MKEDAAIHVLREGQPVGPLTPEGVRAELAAGRLRGSDLAWTAGQAGWRPLAELVGGGPTTSPAASVVPPPPPPPVPGGASVVHAAAPRLWNLRAAGRWGIFLGPALPAFLASRNWKALGDSARAAAARQGFYLLAAVQVIIQAAGFFVGGGSGRGLTVLWLALGGVYHYFGARPAAAAQQARGSGGTGPGRSLWPPVLAGVGAQLAVALALGVVVMLWEEVGAGIGSPQLEVTAIPGGLFGQPAAVLVTSHEETPVTVRRVVANGHADLRHRVTIAAGFMPGSAPWKEARLKTGESLGVHVEDLGIENLVRVRVETDRGTYECRFEASSQQ